MHERANWHKSSYSGPDSGCVEVSLGAAVGIRDTKDRARGQFTLSPAAWCAALAAVDQPGQAR